MPEGTVPRDAIVSSVAVSSVPDGSADPIETEKSRKELEKLELEVQEQKAWRWKLLLATLTPIGSVLLFLIGWHTTHLTERRQQNQDLYARAAKQLASPDASVRLSGVKAIDAFIETSEASSFQTIFTSKTTEALNEERKREAMSLVIASLLREDDPAVLETISDEVKKYPNESVDPLVSENKAAAVAFARAAGTYSGLSVLRMNRKASVFEDDWKKKTRFGTNDYNDPTITDIVIITLRTGSPFEATDTYNQRFTSRNFLTTPKCPFKDLFTHQQILAMNSGLNDFSRTKPPSGKELQVALKKVIETAAVLERSSYLLGDFAQNNGAALDDWSKREHETLYGAAVVVGQPDRNAVNKLRSLGAYFGSPEEDNDRTNSGCVVPKS